MVFTLHCAFYETALVSDTNSHDTTTVQNITICFDRTPPLHELKKAAMLMAKTYGVNHPAEQKEKPVVGLLHLLATNAASNGAEEEENRWAVELFALSAVTRTWQPMFSANQMYTGDQVFALFIDTVDKRRNETKNIALQQQKQPRASPPPFASFAHTLRSLYYYTSPFGIDDRAVSQPPEGLHFDNHQQNPLTSTCRNKLFWSDYEPQNFKKGDNNNKYNNNRNEREGERMSKPPQTSYHPLHNDELQSFSKRKGSTAAAALAASSAPFTPGNSTSNQPTTRSASAAAAAAAAGSAVPNSRASSILSLSSLEVNQTLMHNMKRASAPSGFGMPSYASAFHQEEHTDENENDLREDDVMARRIQFSFHTLDAERKGYIVLRDFYACFLPVLLPPAKSGGGGQYHNDPLSLSQRRRSQLQQRFSTYTFPTEHTHGGVKNKNNNNNNQNKEASRSSMQRTSLSGSLSGGLPSTSRCSVSQLRPFRRSCGCPTHTLCARSVSVVSASNNRSRATSDAAGAAARERGEVGEDEDVVTPEMFQLFYVDPKSKTANAFLPNKENVFGSAPQEKLKRLKAREVALFTLTFEEMIRRADYDKDGRLFMAEWSRFCLLHPQVVVALHKHLTNRQV